MKSDNYNPDLGYFSILFKHGVNNTITTYALDPKTLISTEHQILNFLTEDWRAGEIKSYLAHIGARQQDFYDETMDIIYPGELKVHPHDTQLITKAYCYKNHLLNDPAENFPARITYSNKPKIEFFTNNAATISRFSYNTTKDYITENHSTMFQQNYGDLITFLNDPKAIFGIAPVTEIHSAAILKR